MVELPSRTFDQASGPLEDLVSEIGIGRLFTTPRPRGQAPRAHHGGDCAKMAEEISWLPGGGTWRCAPTSKNVLDTLCWNHPRLHLLDRADTSISAEWPIIVHGPIFFCNRPPGQKLITLNVRKCPADGPYEHGCVYVDVCEN